MGNYNEAIIDQEVTSVEQARDQPCYDGAEQIIENRQHDGCLREGACYSPGRRFMQACGGVENDASNGNYDTFSTEAINGLYVVTSRSAVCNMQGQFGPVACPACGASTPLDNLWRAGGKWIETAGDSMTCDSCGRASILPRWAHPDIGFVALAFEFWNWSPLSDEFIAAVSARLGHSVTTIRGKV